MIVCLSGIKRVFSLNGVVSVDVSYFFSVGMFLFW